jgi:hypothetical protein
VTTDHYSILGVTPAAEDVVIRAAYRALMRHYHPDTNPDPQAQDRVRAITAAFAVLRDPSRRAEYDALRSCRDLWRPDEIRLPPNPSPAPAMRGWALGSAALALALVVAVWAKPLPEPQGSLETVEPSAGHAAPAKPQPIVELEPESVRLARLHTDSGGAVAEPVMAIPVDRSELGDPAPKSAVTAVAATARSPRPAPRPLPAIAEQKADIAESEASAGCRPGGSVIVSAACKNARIATLDRLAAGFFSQSMAHADAARKALLMSSHTRSAEARGACHSDSCLGDAYLRQMREMSAIMAARPDPEQ